MDLFLSYRRVDTAEESVTLVEFLERLSEEGKLRVFRDVRDARYSPDWLKGIQSAIDRSRAVLVLIGDRWLDVTSGKSRLHDPNDIVRRELEYALKNEKRIFPLLVRGATMPDIEQLPESLHAFTRIQATSLSSLTGVDALMFAAHMARILADKAADEEKEELSLLEKGAANPEWGLRIDVELPDHPDFQDFPLYGEWRITITEGARARYELNLDLNDDMGFVGTFLPARAGWKRLLPKRLTRRSMDGSWSLGAGRDARMLMKLKGLLDRREPFQWNLPINEKVASGYAGRDQEGRVYFYTVKGGRTQTVAALERRRF